MVQTYDFSGRKTLMHDLPGMNKSGGQEAIFAADSSLSILCGLSDINQHEPLIWENITNHTNDVKLFLIISV